MPESMQPGKSVDDMIRFFAARTKSMFYHVLYIKFSMFYQFLDGQTLSFNGLV